MKTPVLLVVFLLALTPCAANAASIAGYWLAPLPNARVVLNISPANKSGWKVLIYHPDQLSDPTIGTAAANFKVDRSRISFSIPEDRASYVGQLNATGTEIVGIWSQDNANQPLSLKKTNASILDSSPHKSVFISVSKNVKLEVLDWGGTGRPLVFLAGLNLSAHEFDQLAPKFTANHHVYAITRRGFGNSSKPAPTSANYSATQLGDDIIAVIDKLGLKRPVLAGHSMAGEELSSIGSRYPEKISGLVYLDAGYDYAFYSPGSILPLGVNLLIDGKSLREELDQLKTIPWRNQGLGPVIARLQKLLPQFETDLAASELAVRLGAEAPATTPPIPESMQDKIGDAILNGTQAYTSITVPILALFEDPPFLPANTPPAIRAAENAQYAAKADAFEAAMPSAKVVRLANARHVLWTTNETDVLREMNAFMDALPVAQ